MPKVNPIPEGHHTLTPHIVVRDAAKAIEFYKRAFGAEELCRMVMPDGKSIGHAEVKIGDSILYLVDENPEWGMKSPLALGGTPVTLHLYVNDVDAAFKRATDAGAQVTMPLMDAFWGDRYGKVADPYGHHWSLATHKEDVPPEEMEARMKKAMSGDCGK